MRVAIVKDFLPVMRGAEKVLEAICEIYPEADIFALFCNPEALSNTIQSHRIATTFIQHFPWVKRYYRFYFPLFPLAIEQIRLARYDLVISVSQCVAKGAIVPAGTPHICYCLTPMRYVWDMVDLYFPGVKKWLAGPMIGYLRMWDKYTANRVDKYIAISRWVAERIWRWYRRRAQVVYPGADEDFYTLATSKRDDFYLVVSALVVYKRIELAVRACKRLNRRLVVIGDGPQMGRLKRIGVGVEFLGWQPDHVLRQYYQRCRALIFPGEEDFGIVPVEAQLCGTPVIAFGRGGVLESVTEGKSGVFFLKDSVDSLCEAIQKFEGMEFDPDTISEGAKRFSKGRFKEGFLQAVKEYISGSRC
jgi:glycosyltransferase involved in cell wall biosynthesis